MSYALALLVLDQDISEEGDAADARTVLHFKFGGEERALETMIRALPQCAVSDFDLYSYYRWESRTNDWAYGRLSNDAYDLPLKMVKAGDLVTLRNHELVRASLERKAAWAYLGWLPPERYVVLFWL